MAKMETSPVLVVLLQRSQESTGVLQGQVGVLEEGRGMGCWQRGDAVEMCTCLAAHGVFQGWSLEVLLFCLVVPLHLYAVPLRWLIWLWLWVFLCFCLLVFFCPIPTLNGKNRGRAAVGLEAVEQKTGKKLKETGLELDDPWGPFQSKPFYEIKNTSGIFPKWKIQGLVWFCFFFSWRKTERSHVWWCRKCAAKSCKPRAQKVSWLCLQKDQHRVLK